jgi:hypothetical protein
MTTEIVPAPTEPGAKNRRNKWERLVEGESILADRNTGLTVSELCTKYGYSPSTIRKRLTEAIETRIILETDRQRELMNAMLDDLTGRWGQQTNMAEEMARVGSTTQDLKLMTAGLSLRADALNGALRVAERRARLNGLDAPVRSDVHVTQATETDRAIEDLTKMMDAMVGTPGAPPPD